MKVKALCFLFPVLIFCSCTETESPEKPCENLVCTEEYASITIQFKDSSGELIDVDNYSAIVKATGKPTFGMSEKTLPIKGTYTIASDMDKNTLSEEGNIIQVSGINPISKQTKTTEIVVKGGKCACHIQKKSGVAVISFD